MRRRPSRSEMREASCRNNHPGQDQLAPYLRWNLQAGLLDLLERKDRHEASCLESGK
ncbi:hypothetical protein [Komagataeibacter diospyri]|uniref:hypothetical protein n=1 Tax=Komagataeibacter diospyri TaxID=1932662 RepID=UPI00375632DD